MWAFSRILGLLSFLVSFSVAQGGQSSKHCNIIAGLRWHTVERQNLWLLSFNMELKRGNGDSQDITFALLNGLILETCLCYHLCPKSELISENPASVATSVQKVGLIILADGLFLKFEDTKTLSLKLM